MLRTTSSLRSPSSAVRRYSLASRKRRRIQGQKKLSTEEKRQLYFEAGAKEFWICGEAGNMRFFNPQGELKKSEIFGEFPTHIDIGIA
ncbi:MAG: hypothetical protein M0Z81_17550 [Deltaproteobacteria bacterium]|nr:hypothetical protein [Deltaproteobacteria bacterium]